MGVGGNQNALEDVILDVSLEAGLVITMKGIYKIEELIK